MYHDELLEQARHLAGRTPETQADLRRALSSAYYALFHFFIHEASEHFVGATAAGSAARNVLTRAFKHTTMRAACECFSSLEEKRRKSQKGQKAPKKTAPAKSAPPIQPPPPPLAPQDADVDIKNVGTVRVPGELQLIADAFIQLQEARARADYDLASPLVKSEVTPLLRKAEDAMGAWAKFRKTDLGHTFLAVLLTFDDLQRHG